MRITIVGSGGKVFTSGRTVLEKLPLVAKFVKAMWTINRELSKNLKEEFSFSERLRASIDFSLYALCALVHAATSGYQVREETSDYIDRSLVLMEELGGLPEDIIEKINEVAFENEPAYMQHKEGSA